MPKCLVCRSRKSLPKRCVCGVCAGEAAAMSPAAKRKARAMLSRILL